jgi:chemotaxis methyl-accepting protein methylase
MTKSFLAKMTPCFCHSQITDLCIRSDGIDVSKYDDSFLNKSLQKRMSEAHCTSLEEYFSLLEQSENERLLFIDSLHICYSEFFRNPLTFAVLERIILPALVLKKKKSKQKEIRIWSAACAGGQEVYSLAILLEELKNGAADQFSYRIFATDQSEAQVHEAIKGQYLAAALHHVSLKRVGEWFTRQGELYTIKAELQNNIAFSTFNLFNEELSCPSASIFGDFDLVVCANLFFYYKNEYRKIILGKIRNSISDDGYLMTGETERDIVMRDNFHEMFPQSALFKRNMI